MPALLPLLAILAFAGSVAMVTAILLLSYSQGLDAKRTRRVHAPPRRSCEG